MPAQAFSLIGAKGQTLINSHHSPERALLGAEKLIAEKLRKRYRGQRAPIPPG